MLGKNRWKGEGLGKEGLVGVWLKKYYEGGLVWGVEDKKRVLGGRIGLFMVGLGILFRLGERLVGCFNEGWFRMNVS